MKIQKMILTTTLFIFTIWISANNISGKVAKCIKGDLIPYELSSISSNLPEINRKSAVLEIPDLVLNILTIDSKRIMRISFNGDEGSDGTLKIYDASHQLVIESNFELIKSPFYASVDISALLSDNYTVELITKIAVHSAKISVK